MDIQDKHKSPGKTIVRSILIIIWWVCVWGLADHLIHHMTSKDPMRKMVVYVGLMLLVLGTIGLDPNLLDHL